MYALTDIPLLDARAFMMSFMPLGTTRLMPDSFFDVDIGNVPFGDFAV